MKNYLLLFLFLALSAYSAGQVSAVSLTTAAGYTMVDLNEAVGVDDLEEWDNIGVMIKASVDFRLSEKLFLVGEAGSNRLYYWEYYWSDGYYDGWRYRSEWTTNFGVHIKTFFGERFYLQAGPGLHIFNDGSGTVPGVVAQAGYTIPAVGSFSIPLLFRIENVMGSGFPVSFLLGTGVSMNFSRE